MHNAAREEQGLISNKHITLHWISAQTHVLANTDFSILGCT